MFKISRTTSVFLDCLLDFKMTLPQLTMYCDFHDNNFMTSDFLTTYLVIFTVIQDVTKI